MACSNVSVASWHLGQVVGASLSREGWARRRQQKIYSSSCASDAEDAQDAQDVNSHSGRNVDPTPVTSCRTFQTNDTPALHPHALIT